MKQYRVKWIGNIPQLPGPTKPIPIVEGEHNYKVGDLLADGRVMAEPKASRELTSAQLKQRNIVGLYDVQVTEG